MDSKENQIILSEDGSHSVESGRFGVSYHSKYGAITESMHVFLQAGLEYSMTKKPKEELRIFEMGFGTGLNVLLSLRFADQHQQKLDFHTIEKYPVQSSLSDQLNYTHLDDLADYELAFRQMHESASNQSLSLSPCFRFTKIIGDALTEELPNDIDVIYFDAFAPSAQAELWEYQFLRKLYHSLSANGVLVTYCAKGSFKRDLKSIGFEIDAIPGPPGKREMTRAIKS